MGRCIIRARGEEGRRPILCPIEMEHFRYGAHFIM